ncbi:MAG: UDP-N-acetylmuramoyl-L-alanine--D-glutamate ligase [Lachnospiraceae bacterium]|nr:UDP-N-acetylmuramoyl-L-alanine--D-glutamate ligase [Lachnospiraceae bacterium]
MKYRIDSNDVVLVVGTGLSGVGAVHLLHHMGAQIILLEQNEEAQEEAIRKKLDPEDAQAPCVVIGALPKEIIDKLTLVVLSPAVPMDIPLVEDLRSRGLPIFSEIELAYCQEQGTILGITGTNGKTTTTTLTGEIMKAWTERLRGQLAGEEEQPEVFVVGNIGYSYAGVADRTHARSFSVAEISSFQLEGIHAFHPAVSAILNITPDHLNRHKTMENYTAIKERITLNQTKEDVCVLNYEDAALRSFADSCPASVVFFSSAHRLDDGFYLDGETICRVRNKEVQTLMNIHDMRLVGICNVENVMAAMAVTEAAGVPMDLILEVIHDFPPVEHRIEYSGTVNGVDYYNDSKATNPDAAIQGIRAMSRPTILIGGGYDKKNTYDEWIEAFDGKVRELVLIGQTKEAIAECARRHGFTAITFCDTFEECMQHCCETAQPGEAVLLSPACASWGMFPNYEERGRQFKEFVKKVGAEASQKAAD